MNDTGWRRNKYGGLFNVNDYMNQKIRKQNHIYNLSHGSNNDFEEFDDKYIGSNSLGGLAFGKGHYFTDLNSSSFGRFNYEVSINVKNPFIVKDEYSFDNKLKEIGYPGKQHVDPSNFLALKGYDCTVIKNGDRVSDFVVYTNEDKKIKITKKNKNW